MRGITFDNEKNPAIIDALLNSYSCSNKTGIFKGYGDNCDINTGISYNDSKATVTFKKGALMICGRVCYIQAGDTLEIPLTATTTGYFGVKVDLSKSVASDELQYEFFSSTTAPTAKNDLLNKETDGVYYFSIYKYTSNGSALTVTKIKDYIFPMSEKIQLSENESTALAESITNQDILFLYEEE